MRRPIAVALPSNTVPHLYVSKKDVALSAIAAGLILNESVNTCQTSFIVHEGCIDGMSVARSFR